MTPAEREQWLDSALHGRSLGHDWPTSSSLLEIVSVAVDHAWWIDNVTRWRITLRRPVLGLRDTIDTLTLHRAFRGGLTNVVLARETVTARSRRVADALEYAGTRL